MPFYKHGKQTQQIDLDTFISIMERPKKPFTQPLSHKSFLVFLYWFGVRRSEALERTPEDFEVKDGMLIVNAPAKKGGERLPLEAPIDLPYIDLIVEKVNTTLPLHRVWPFSTVTAWKIVKRAMGPKYYPHFFRLNRATRFLEDPETTAPDMLAWFGWKSKRTIDRYVGYSHRNVRRQANRLKQELE